MAPAGADIIPSRDYRPPPVMAEPPKASVGESEVHGAGHVDLTLAGLVAGVRSGEVTGGAEDGVDVGGHLTIPNAFSRASRLSRNSTCWREFSSILFRLLSAPASADS